MSNYEFLTFDWWTPLWSIRNVTSTNLLDYEFSRSTTAVCMVLTIIAVLLLVLVLIAVTDYRKSRSRESSLLKKIQARDESLIAYVGSLEILCSLIYYKDQNIATLKNYLEEDKSQSCYAVYIAQLIDHRRSWEDLSIYAGSLSKGQNLSELDKDETMIRVMNTHLAKIEELCSRINEPLAGVHCNFNEGRKYIR